MITLEALAKLVRDMRYAQRQYFKTRTPTARDDAIQIERRVDKVLRDVLPPARARGPLPGQGSFFADDEEDAR